MKHLQTFEQFLNESKVNEETHPYRPFAEAALKKLIDSKVLQDYEGVEANLIPQMSGARQGDIGWWDCVYIYKVGVNEAIYIVPKNMDGVYELYTEKSYKQGKELAKGDMNEMIKKMGRYLKKFFS